MRYITTFLIILATFQANSQYLNQVNKPSTEGVLAYQSILSKTHLYYETEVSKDDNVLWSMNLTSKKKEQIVTGATMDIIWPMVELDDFVYFKVENKSLNSSNGFLMRSDGTAENTVRVNEIVVSDQIKTSGDQLFMTDPQRKLLQLINDDFLTFDIEVPDYYAICVFEEDHFVVQTQNVEQDNYSLIRFDQGELTELYNYTTPALFSTFSIQHDNNCYFTISNSELGQTDLKPTIITVPKQGDAQTFQTITDIPDIHGVFAHQQRLYVIAGEGLSSNSVYRLTQNLSGFDASYSLDAGLEFTGGLSANHLIRAYTRPSDEYFATNISFLDADLNLIPTYPNLSESFSLNSSPTAFNVLVGLQDNGFSNSIIQTINPKDEVAVTTIKNYSFGQIISNPGLDQYYLVLSQSAGRRGIYSINDQPILNGLINGAWHDPEIKNQGLVIQKGRRDDGSEYVFTTLFTYDQGEPLWLAGNVDLISEQQQLSITLYQYDGPQFLEYNVTPNQREFGELSLELENCDNLKVNISSESYDKTLSLSRIDDTSYKYLCVDITTESLDEVTKNVSIQGEVS